MVQRLLHPATARADAASSGNGARPSRTLARRPRQVYSGACQLSEADCSHAQKHDSIALFPLQNKADDGNKVERLGLNDHATDREGQLTPEDRHYLNRILVK